MIINRQEIIMIHKSNENNQPKDNHPCVFILYFAQAAGDKYDRIYSKIPGKPCK